MSFSSQASIPRPRLEHTPAFGSGLKVNLTELQENGKMRKFGIGKWEKGKTTKQKNEDDEKYGKNEWDMKMKNIRAKWRCKEQKMKTW